MSTIVRRHLRRAILCLLALTGLHTTLDAQEAMVRGQVLDEQTSTPIAGVSVLVQGRTTGTITNARGEFLLNVADPEATLVFSHVGYRRHEVPLAGQTNIVVRLTSQAVHLDELVVVGYGVQRRGDVTGSVAIVAQDRLENVPVVSVQQAIQGAAPGVRVAHVQAGAEPVHAIEIRGRNSLTASVQPLLVVDGIPYSGNLAEISPNDIESISILKDASAAAIYGSRGANGVILLTTKRGAGGTRMAYDGYVGSQRVANMPQLMSGMEFAAFKCERARGGVPVTNAQGQFDLDACFNLNLLTPSEYEVAQSGQFTDWLGESTRLGRQQQHTLSVSGSEGGTRFFVSGTVLDIAGVARGDKFDRYNLRVNVEQRVNSWIQLGTSNLAGWTDRSGVPVRWGGDSGAYTLNPLSRAFNGDGSQTVYPWPEESFFANPLQALQFRNEDLQRRFFSSNFAELRLPLDGLAFRVNAGLDVSARNAKNYQPRTVAAAYNLGRATLNNWTSRDWTLENVLRFNRSLGSHTFDVTGLYSFQGTEDEATSLETTNFPHDITGAFRPELGSVSRVGTPSYAATGMISQMGRLNYSYAGRYLATATVRRDGSSVFGPANKWAVFPSFALGWNISEEAFWPGPGVVNTMRLRFSHGQNGNQAIRAYQSLSTLVSSPYYDGRGSIAGFGIGWFDGSSLQQNREFNTGVSGVIGNPNLKWETTTSSNLALDFGLLNNRVSGSVDVYRSSTTDLLVSRSISPTHGLPSILTNIGELQNRGVELELSGAVINSGRFQWTTDFNISANRNKIVDLYGDGQDDPGNGWFLGHPIRTNFGFVHDGVWQVGQEAEAAKFNQRPGDIRIRDLNGDGVINNDDRMIQHAQEPNYVAGMNNTLRYGSASFSFFLYTVQGGMRNNGFYNIEGWVQNNTRRNGPVLDHWTPTNQQNFIPANRPNANPSNRASFYEDPSFIRLRDATLAFDIPNSVRRNLGLSKMRMYVTGTNLWTRTKWMGLDPELNQDIFVTTGGPNGTPLERTWILGVNAGM
jgi:TonB-linked SusC/RagA family outer membrane protein